MKKTAIVLLALCVVGGMVPAASAADPVSPVDETLETDGETTDCAVSCHEICVLYVPHYGCLYYVYIPAAVDASVQTTV